jgi:hypothetical protein
MPVLRKLTLTALAAGTVIAAPSAALASAAPPAHPANAAVAKIHQVACRPWTFNVRYDGLGEKCYEGTGTIRLHIPNVHMITTGENTGIFDIRATGVIEHVPFRPNGNFNFSPNEHAELLLLDITRA